MQLATKVLLSLASKSNTLLNSLMRCDGALTTHVSFKIKNKVIITILTIFQQIYWLNVLQTIIIFLNEKYFHVFSHACSLQLNYKLDSTYYSIKKYLCYQPHLHNNHQINFFLWKECCKLVC